MTDGVDAYVRSHGAACPVCGSCALDRAPPSLLPENGRLTMWVGCEACRATWLEVYRLSDCEELSDVGGEPIDIPRHASH